MDKTLEDIGIDREFLKKTSIAQKIISETDKWDYMNQKSFQTTERAQWVKALIPSSDPGTHMEGTKSHKLSSDLKTQAIAHTCALTHTHTQVCTIKTFQMQNK